MAKRKGKQGGRKKGAGERAEVIELSAFTAQHSDYRATTVVDLNNELGGGRQRMATVLRNLYPCVVDRWLAEGGPGFDEPQRAAIDHCRSLWAMIGTQRLCANYTGTIGGEGDAEGQAFALSQLAEYQEDIPNAYWRAFENVVRFDMPAGQAGSHLAKTTSQQQAHAKAATGFVASLIAQWRGY